MSSCLWQKLIAKRYSDVTKAEADILNQAFVEAPYLFQSSSSSTSTTDQASFRPRKRQRTYSGDNSSISTNSVAARHLPQDQQSDKLSDRQPDRQTPTPSAGLNGSISSASASASTSISGPSVASLLQDTTTSDTPASSQSRVTNQPVASTSSGTNGRIGHSIASGFNGFSDFNTNIFHTSAPDPLWRPHALSATEALGIGSEDARFLFILLSFLASRVPVSLLVRGATPRKRWGAQGELDEANAFEVGLALELMDLLSNESQLRNLLNELVQARLVFHNEDETYTVKEDVATKLRNGLPGEQLVFWRFQAVVVAYRAVPWKYLESVNLDMKGDGYTRHIQHVMEAATDLLPTCRDSVRSDIALSLLEASRFPTMRWKRFCVGYARSLSRGLELTAEDEEYLRCRMAEAEAVLYRLSGNTSESTRALDSLANISNSTGSLLSLCHKRLHAALGLAAVQRALNAIQIGDVQAAHKTLDDWRPIGSSSCPLEEVVVVRKYMIMGRMHRLSGRFKDAKLLLGHSQSLINRRTHSLVYGEEMRDLVCDLADTVRELDEAVDAEHRLRAEIAEARPEAKVFRGHALLQLSLAEALFAQQHYCEAEQLCRDIKIRYASSSSNTSNTSGCHGRQGLLKVERLRINITLAKLRHVQQDDKGAMPFWIEALASVDKLPLDTGGTIRVIIASINDILNRRSEVADQRSGRPSKNGGNSASAGHYSTATLPDKTSRPPGTTHCYVAGLGRWSDYLQAKARQRPGYH